MARLGKKKISRRTVEALKVEKDTIFWDSELAGFAVRVHPTGRKVYIAQTRADGKAAKRVTVGRHGVITADEARRRAALIVSRIKAGEEAIPEPMAAKLAGGPTRGRAGRAISRKARGGALQDMGIHIPMLCLFEGQFEEFAATCMKFK